MYTVTLATSEDPAAAEKASSASVGLIHCLDGSWAQLSLGAKEKRDGAQDMNSGRFEINKQCP